MNALLVYPEYPDTFWSFKHAIRFISKQSVYPPLGLLTVAAMLPGEWNKKLVDINVARLKDRHIDWADMVFISAMGVQEASARTVIQRCVSRNTTIVAGGPLFTENSETFPDVDHFVLNEAEMTLPPFLSDLRHGKTRRIYSSEAFPDLATTPLPLWDLLEMKKYVSMNIQYSRGCPFNCDFCSITSLFGRKVRTKSALQVVNELDLLYRQKWRGGVFIVDDNFIGNRDALKQEVLPAMIDWMTLHNFPFTFNTEASIDLADDDELISLMVRAGFDQVFIGIETPETASLEGCGKIQNSRRDLSACVRKIQSAGMEVTGGFIVGFDDDPPSIFKRQIEFIQKNRIITAMVGLLNAPRNTRLYKRLKQENRLLGESTGNNTDFSINFIPRMDYTLLIRGYNSVVQTIYSCKPYYQRVTAFLNEKRSRLRHLRQSGDAPPRRGSRIRFHHIKAMVRSVFVLGLRDRGRRHFWKLIIWCLFRCPRLFPEAVTFAIYGFHFRRVFNTH